MKKDKEFLFDEDRGLVNQQSSQTKSSHSTDLTKNNGVNNSICKIQEKLMNLSDLCQKEIWNTSKIIEEFHYNLISVIGEDGLRKYEEIAKFLLYRIPIYRDPKTGDQQASVFTIDLQDLFERVKEQLTDSSDIEISRSIVIEAVSQLFENLGPKEKEYFNKSVRHLLKVKFV